MTENNMTWHGTTILSVRKNGEVVVAGDGQVTFGNTVIKGRANKVRRFLQALLLLVSLALLQMLLHFLNDSKQNLSSILSN